MQHSLFFVVALIASGPAFAQLSPVGPFSGDSYEGFEYYPQQGVACLNPLPLAGEAELCGPAPDTVNCSFTTANWVDCGAGTINCYIFPRLGNRLLTAINSRFDLTFQRPVKRFGAWFAHSYYCPEPDDLFEFYDASGALLHSEAVSINYNCGWQWFGWETSGTPIAKIRFNPTASHLVPTLGVDDMEVDYFAPSYCTAGVTSSGCTASISATDLPDVGHSGTCVVSVSGVEGQRAGIVFYGLAPQSQPWCPGGTSYRCTTSPAERTGLQNSGGTVGACDGAFTLDWNAYQVAHPFALGTPWVAGENVYLQAWLRDPGSCNTSALSNAIVLTYEP